MGLRLDPELSIQFAGSAFFWFILFKDAGKLGAVVGSSTTTEVTDSWLQKALEHKRTGK